MTQVRVIDEEAMTKLKVMDIHNPPTKQVTAQEFPKALYRHPKSDRKTITVRDNQGNISERTVPSSHLSKLVNSQEELKAALEQGWRRDPYVSTFDPGTVIDDEQYESAPEVKRGPGRPRNDQQAS